MLEFAVKKNGTNSIHQQLVAGLRHLATQLEPDTKMPSENMICKKYSLARMTVSQALNSLVSEGILYRIQGKGTFVKEQVKAGKAIKFLLPGPGCLTNTDVSARIIRQFLSGTVAEAHRNGMHVETMICTPDHKPGSLRPEQFRALNKDDNVFIVAQWWYSVFPAIAESGCNVVYVNHQITNPDFANYFKHWYLLTHDVREDTASLIDYFVKIGRHNILGFEVDDEFTNPDPRAQGYMSGLTRNRLDYFPELMPKINYTLFRNPRQTVDLFVDTYKKRKFDAVILPSSEYASLVFPALDILGLKCPDDVAVAGLSDRREFFNSPVPITSLTYSAAELGAEAVRIFSRQEFTPGEKVYNSKLIERESTMKGAGRTANPFLDEDFSQYRNADENVFIY